MSTQFDFDAGITNDAEQWLSKAIALQSSNYSCGIFGFGVLHGVLLLAKIEQGTRFTSHFLCRLAPTYTMACMMVRSCHH